MRRVIRHADDEWFRRFETDIGHPVRRSITWTDPPLGQSRRSQVEISRRDSATRSLILYGDSSRSFRKSRRRVKLNPAMIRVQNDVKRRRRKRLRRCHGLYLRLCDERSATHGTRCVAPSPHHPIGARPPLWRTSLHGMILAAEADDTSAVNNSEWIDFNVQPPFVYKRHLITVRDEMSYRRSNSPTVGQQYNQLRRPSCGHHF